MKSVSRKAGLAGLIFSLSFAAEAASSYAVSIGQITNFSMTASAGSASIMPLTFSNTAVADANGNGGSELSTLDAPASQLGDAVTLNWQNDFQKHDGIATAYVYGDAEIANNDILGGTGAAHSIAEVKQSAGGYYYATASNSMSAIVNLTDMATVSFSYDLDATLETLGVGSLSTMSMLVSLGGWSDSFVIDTSTAGTIQVTTAPMLLAAGMHSLTLEMRNTVSVQPVPVPAAVWLFGSGLVGLVGVARRRKAT